jgi:hypothetical protein
MARKKSCETNRPATWEQQKELIATLVQAIPRVSFARTQYWLAHKSQLIAKVKAILAEAPEDQYADLRNYWQNFYHDVFSRTVDLSGLVIPPKREGFSRILVLIPGITAQLAFDVCTKLFKTWKYTEEGLDEVVAINDRDANKTGAYAIWVRDRQEADRELKNRSAYNLTAQGIKCETLAERLIHELVYFKETGKHLDINNRTLCAGSRLSGSGVPGVRWTGNYGKLGVDWYGPGIAVDDLRAREAVS